MARRRRTFARAITSRLLMATISLLGILPLWGARWVARRMGRLAWFIIPRAKSVGMCNLDLAYGDQFTYAQKKAIILESLENMAIVAVEFPHTPRLHGGFLEKTVEVRGVEHLRGGPRILVGAHIGNWEWLAPIVGGLGFKIAEIVRPLEHRALDAYIENTRRTNGVETIPKHEAQQRVLELLKSGSHVGILLDQNPRQNAVPVNFFGHRTWSTIAPVLFAVRAGVPVHPLSITRKPDDTYCFEVFPEVLIIRRGKLSDDILENTQRCQTAVEDIVRRNPGQWLWLHKRWVERPRLEREWADRQARAKEGVDYIRE
jgi:KDO2-lipid IV(A) lauroyltransferase